MKTYNLIAFGKRIPVDEATYKTYYQAYEKERYQTKLSLTHTLSLERLEASGMIVESQMSQRTKSTEEVYETIQKKDALEKALNILEKGERERFLALAYGEATERSLAEKY